MQHGSAAAARLRNARGAGRRRLPGTLTIPVTEGLVKAASNASKIAAASRFRFTTAAVR